MSDVKALATPSGSSNNNSEDVMGMTPERQANLKSRYSTKKATVKKTATSVHLNPVPAKHKATQKVA